MAQTSSRATYNCYRLGTESWLGEAAEVPRPGGDNFVEARHGAHITLLKAGDPARADSFLGGRNGGGK